MENRAGDFGGIVAHKTSWRNDSSFRRCLGVSLGREWWIGTCMSGISVPTGWDSSAPPHLLCGLSGAVSLCRSQVGCWITSFSEVTDILPNPIARTRLLARKFKTFWVIGLFLRGSWDFIELNSFTLHCLVGQRCTHISFSVFTWYLKGLGDMHWICIISYQFHFRAHFLMADIWLTQEMQRWAGKSPGL